VQFHKKCARICGLGSMDSTKNGAGTHYAQHVFLNSVGSAGHVVHYGGSEAQNGNTLFFNLGWDRYGFDKKVRWDGLRRTCVFASGGICESGSAFRCIRGAKQ
jgi:hypothetical protein